MKILNTAQIKELDQFTASSRQISLYQLMQEAAAACYSFIGNHYSKESFKRVFHIFCGMGNNGGDGLLITRLLRENGFSAIAYIISHKEQGSADFKEARICLSSKYPDSVQEVSSASQLLHLQPGDVIIDALIGTGLNRTPEGLLADTIEFLNKEKEQRGLDLIAIDMPTGLRVDEHTDNIKYIVKATLTLCFEIPRLSFMFPESDSFTGDWLLLNIGLDKGFIAKSSSRYNMLEVPQIQGLLKPLNKFAHKGIKGHTLIAGGSYGKMGAALLSAKAALRAGAGLVSAYIPKCGYEIFQTAIPEAMCRTDEDSERYLNSFPKLDERISAIGIGPGLGQEPGTQNMLKRFIQDARVPLVIDADGLNILSENKTWLHFLTPASILTPHIKEFERLTGKALNSFERLKKQEEFSLKYRCFVVLKGAHTCITTPDGDVYFNSSGNPGMATAGSGDVLTGIIASLCGQGYSAKAACLLGVYLHGLAGDLIAQEKGERGIIAGDLIEAIPRAYHKLSQPI